MTSDAMSRGFLEQAEDALAHGEASFSRRRWGMTVRRSQEAAEMAIKAALRWVGVEAPRQHDVAEVLRAARGKFPAPFAGELDEFAAWSTDLADKRIVSFYGDERAGQPANALFGEADASAAVSRARRIVASVRRLVGA